MYRILVCDDEKDIVSALRIYLEAEGHEVLAAYTGAEALAALEKEEVHLVLLDIMMPQMDGITAMTRIRERSNVPVILLTAKSEDTDKVLGLNLGADDYVTKPFSPLELIARVRSQIRRYTDLGSMAGIDRGKLLHTGGLIIDDDAKRVTLDGEEIQFTPTEYGILKFLTENAGRVYSTGQIYEAVWNEPSINTEGTVTVHIRRIREKIEIDPKNPRYLKVVWGLGYKMEKF